MPLNFAHGIAGGTVSFTWTAPSEGDPPSSYLLEAGSAPGQANLASVSVGNVVAVSFSNVPRGTYYVRLKAVNAAGVSAPTPTLVVVVP
jgi:hypothetical protein